MFVSQRVLHRWEAKNQWIEYPNHMIVVFLAHKSPLHELLWLGLTPHKHYPVHVWGEAFRCYHPSTKQLDFENSSSPWIVRAWNSSKVWLKHANTLSYPRNFRLWDDFDPTLVTSPRCSVVQVTKWVVAPHNQLLSGTSRSGSPYQPGGCWFSVAEIDGVVYALC